MIDAAIVGLGRWGRTLVEAVQGKSRSLRFTRAVSRDPPKLRDFAANHRLDIVDAVEPILADPKIDAVVIATPHSLHCDQIIAVAQAGKAVFCEKPLTLTKAEALRAIEACRDAGVVLGVGTDKRFFPSLRELIRLVKTGEFGSVLHLEVRRVQSLLLAHKPPPDPLDSLSVLLEFASGVSGTLAAVRSTPLYMRVHAFARNASAEALGRTELVLRRSTAEPQHLSFDPVDSVRVNLDAFADAVGGLAPYPIPTSEILATVAAFEAVTTAAGSDGRIQEV
jgi:predicted dehydrogenase